MKIIHASDIHIGSKLLDYPKDKKEIRRLELLESFTRLIDYANDNNIKHILLSGDVFDNNKVNKSDKGYFYNAIRSNPDISFYYLKGNHDINESYNEFINNLYTFDNEFKKYDLGNVSITACELSDSIDYSSLSLEVDKYNIVMLHGDISSTGKNSISLNKLQYKNINYLALGHIHKYKSGMINSGSYYAYSGCLEGRGFDEVGEKGFIVIDTDNKSFEFIKFSKREIKEYIYNVNELKLDSYTLREYINRDLKKEDSKNIIRITIMGESEYSYDNLDTILRLDLENCFFMIDIKINVKELFKLSEYKNEISLRGELSRLMEDGNEELAPYLKEIFDEVFKK